MHAECQFEVLISTYIPTKQILGHAGEWSKNEHESYSGNPLEAIVPAQVGPMKKVDPTDSKNGQSLSLNNIVKSYCFINLS